MVSMQHQFSVPPELYLRYRDNLNEMERREVNDALREVFSDKIDEIESRKNK